MIRNARTRRTAVACVVVAAALVAAQDASAARAYNFTKRAIKIQALHESQVEVGPEGKSPSVEWTNAILVYHPDAASSKPVCHFGENLVSGGNWLRGGNYLLVVQHQTKVSCTVCDSGRKIIAKRHGWVKAGSEYTTPSRPEHGCE